MFSVFHEATRSCSLILRKIFKTNLGKMYVQLAPGGQVGASGALARKVQKATIQAGQCSISNFAPFVPEVDLINIPYWCSENQKFVNLVTSDAWKNEINPKIEARGFKALWYPSIDPRTVAVVKALRARSRRRNRCGGSSFGFLIQKFLQRFYRQLGANPIPVEWVEAAAALRRGTPMPWTRP